ncbi:MAG TPA: carboxypeptidase regulatory-like domain-containing protein, partial [Thermoplasmatales archaeon]|nr:carboxypeptidase regulatory-like domain-containing protein [Thermoplasmatales archaeon]
LTVKNNDTGEWIYIPVSDNDTNIPWNTAYDYEYWGRFNISSSTPTRNSSAPGDTPVLNVKPGDTLVLKEIGPGYPLDNDTDVATITIMVVNCNPINATLCGYVNYTNGTTVSNATIYINKTDGQIFSASTITDDSGFYIFNDSVPPGTYDILVYINGFLSWIVENETIYEGDIKWVNISIPINEGNGTLCGFIVDNATGNPIGDAIVSIDKVDGGFFHASVSTGNDGFYIFNNISAGIYDITVSTAGDNYTISGVEVIANETTWRNISLDLSGTSGTGIAGIVKDEKTGSPLPNAIVRVLRRGPEGDMVFETQTNETGEFFIPLNEAGGWEVQVELEGYISYLNWHVEVTSGNTTYLTVFLTPEFKKPSYLVGRINSSLTGEILTNAMVVLLDTDFTHMSIPVREGSNNETVNGLTNCFNFTVTYDSTYRLIVFKEGYYVKIVNVTGIEEGSIVWYNVSLDLAAPDTLNLRVEFFDLDDARVTVNRTIIASAPIVRFLLDFMPDIGNSNQIVDEEEVASYLFRISRFGPTFSVKPPQEADNEKEGEPDFLSTPVSIKLDGSNLSRYLPGSHHGELDNICNTTVVSNDII